MRLPPRKPRRRVETDIVGDIRIALGKLPYVVVFRNNTGALKNEHGRLVTYGLCEGSSDLIGIVAAWVGHPYQSSTVGRFFALEVKVPGNEPTAEQDRFLTVVGSQGGAAGWCDSVAGAIEFIERARRLEI